MEFFRDTKIDFMKYRKSFVMLSLALLAVGILAVFFHGKLNLGIDFAGGTQLTLKFREQPEIDELRDIVADAGIGDAQLQRFGEEGANEVIMKSPTL
ncbi:MAG: protein translocase subunit SecDF, partial [Thermoanaerobaculia bacterium]